MKLIPIGIYLISLSLLYMTSMQGFYLVGSDIHSEYYIASKMYYGWDMNYPHLYNASLSTAWLAPALSKFFDLDLINIFKLVYPAIFATVPVILYFTYRKVTDNWKSIYAVCFFIFMPVFFLEMPQLPRQMIAEVFLCLSILSMVSDWKYKYLVMIPSAVITVFLHYTVGFITLAFYIGMLLVKIVGLKWKWALLQNSKVEFEPLIITIVMIMGCSLIWGMNIAGGLSLKAISNLFSVGVPQAEAATITTTTGVSDGMISAAVGLDVVKVSTWGIVFRVIQWITQLLIISGCINVLVNYKRYNFTSEFVAGICGSCILLIMCLTVFGFSGLLGITRFYHMALIFLAPMFVLGGDYANSSRNDSVRILRKGKG